MSITIMPRKSDTAFSLNSDVVDYVNGFSANDIKLSCIIIQKDTPLLEVLAVLPFYSQLVVDCYSSTSRRDKCIYDLLRRREYLSNIRNVKWMVGVEAPLSELFYVSLGLRNLTHLEFGEDFNCPLTIMSSSDISLVQETIQERTVPNALNNQNEVFFE